MFRRLTATAVAGALAVTAVGMGTAYAAPGDIYRLPHADTLYQQIEVEGTAVVVELSYEEWQGQGFPRFRRIDPPRSYVKVSYSPVVYALTDWPGAAVDLVPHAMGFSEWANSGHPTPVVDNASLLSYVKYPTSAEIFAVTPAAEFDKLSYEQWAAVSFPEPVELREVGFAKLTWSPGIALFVDADLDGLDAAEGTLISNDEWFRFDYPTPQGRTRFEGDSFYYGSPPSPELFYSGPTYSGPITYEQWMMAGFPPPEAPPAAGSTAAAVLPDGAARAVVELAGQASLR